MGILKAKCKYSPKLKKALWIITESKKNVNVDEFDVNLTKNFRKGDLISMCFEDFLFIREAKSFSAEHTIEVHLCYFYLPSDNILGPRFRLNIYATLIKP